MSYLRLPRGHITPVTSDCKLCYTYGDYYPPNIGRCLAKLIFSGWGENVCFCNEFYVTFGEDTIMLCKRIIEIIFFKLNLLIITSLSLCFFPGPPLNPFQSFRPKTFSAFHAITMHIPDEISHGQLLPDFIKQLM